MPAAIRSRLTRASGTLLVLLGATLSACGGGSAAGVPVSPSTSAAAAVTGATTGASAGIASKATGPAAIGVASTTGVAANAAGGVPQVIAQIEFSGAAVKVFDHLTDQQEPDNLPDAQISAWREANGTVSLMIPSTEAYRMRGADLLHLSMDPAKIYSSRTGGSQIGEASHDYHHWFMGPYSVDGVHFYTVSHSEWYACLLDADCDQTGANGVVAQLNSWANTLNDFVSSDGGAHWQLNVSNGNHVVADTSYHWTGSVAQTSQVYLQALNHGGLFQPSRLVQEGNWWYCVAYYIHRDFSQINPSAGVYQAPIDQSGYVLLRTADFTNPNGWQAWAGGTQFAALAGQTLQTFLPQQNGTALDAAPPQLLFDRTARVFVLFHTVFGGINPIYYMTSPSLAAPAWSDSTAVVGSAGFTSDPAGAVQGFNDANYPSVLDPASPGYNFEYINGSPWLFYSTSPGAYGGDNTARDVYRVPLTVSYTAAAGS